MIVPADSRKLLTWLQRRVFLSVCHYYLGLKRCIFLSFIVFCLLQPTANYDLAIIEDYLARNAKIKISIKKQNGVVVIFGEPWQLLLTGSAVPRILHVWGYIPWFYQISKSRNFIFVSFAATHFSWPQVTRGIDIIFIFVL